MPRPAATRAHPVRAPRAPRRRSAGGTLLGIFIGLVLGLGLAAVVVFYVTGGWKAYQSQLAASSQARDAKDAGKQAKAEPDKPRFDFYKILPGNEEPRIPQGKAPEKAPDRAVAEKAAGKITDAPAKVADKAGDKTAEKGTEKAADKGAERVATADPKAVSTERFWLQAGSFSTESDAENLKARLALAGWEASVQQGALADKSVRYRVRLGPFDNTDELNRMKAELGRRGFDVAVIKY
jgi:cell division protein FtsN